MRRVLKVLYRVPPIWSAGEVVVKWKALGNELIKQPRSGIMQFGFWAFEFIRRTAMALFKKKQQGKTVELAVGGMHCGHCVMRVEKSLNQVAGVESVQVSLDDNQAVVTVDPARAPTTAALIAAVEEAGYQAEATG